MDKKFNQLINHIIQNISDVTIENVVSDTEVVLKKLVLSDDEIDTYIKIVLNLDNKGTARECYTVKLYYNEREIKLSSKSILGTVNIIEDYCVDILKNKKKTNKEYLIEAKEFLLVYLESKGYDIDKDTTINEDSNIKIRVDVENLDILSFRLDILREKETTLFKIVSIKKVKVNRFIEYGKLEEELNRLIDNYDNFGVISIIEEDKINKDIIKKEDYYIKKGYSIVDKKEYTYDKIVDSYTLLSKNNKNVKIYVSENPNLVVKNDYGNNGNVSYIVEVSDLNNNDSMEVESDAKKYISEKDITKTEGNIDKKKTHKKQCDREFKTDNNRMKALINYLNIHSEMLKDKGISYSIKEGKYLKDYEVIFETKKHYIIRVEIDKITMDNNDKGDSIILYNRKSYISQTKEMVETEEFIVGIINEDSSYEYVKKAILTSFNLKTKYHKEKVY